MKKPRTKLAVQAKNSAKRKEPCPIADVAELLSDSWTIRILHELLGGTCGRFCEIERSLEGISTRTLTLKLKTLEKSGIVDKTEEGYCISETGLKLKPVFKEMERFGKHL